MRELFIKFKHLIAYAVFGVLTTIINIVTYWFCYNKYGITNVVSNIIAWILAILFAFITNKLWVFDSKKLDIGTVLTELWKFAVARIATGIIDLAIMYVGVDVLHGPSTVLKVVVNIIVIILNYILSKLVVFRNMSGE